ncbi:DMT family transporter [Campylobacter mucosalis]|uniref:DMT family transporter n=1 Tax=Campylobacter mucosalis TaxID=202 RepID=UPI0014707FBD|nr:DMT family transporter [Campylobacter mucosalis]
MKNKEILADIALIFTAIVWGATFLPMGNATLTNGVFTILFYRFLASFIIMSIIAFKFDKFFDKNSLKSGLLLGSVLFIGFASQTFALKFSPTSSVAFISGLNVAIVPFVAYLFLRSKISKYAYIGILFGCVGLYFLSSFKFSMQFLQSFTGMGNTLSLVCAFAWAFHIVLTSIFAKKCEIFTLIATQFGVVCVFSAIFAFGFEGGVSVNLDDKFYLAMVVSVLFASIFGFIMQAKMLTLTTPIKAALIFTLEPVSAGILGYFVAKETLSTLQILGAFIILIGVLISEIGTIKEKANR